MKSGTMARGDTALAQAVAAARRQGVDPAALARVQAGVLAAAGSTPAPALPEVSGLWSRVRWPHLGGGALLLVAALQLMRSQDAPVPPAVVPIAAPVAAPSVAVTPPAPAPPPVLAPAAAPQLELPLTAPEQASPPRRRGLRPELALALPEPAAAPSLDVEGELALLRRALSALPRQPTLALELAEQHAREHAHGAFAQEREAIAIDACIALQRTAAAEVRVRSFLAAYPRSPHATRLRALLGQQEATAAPTHGQAPSSRRKENR